MGNFASKNLEELLKPTKSQETPKSQVLPFDPRSPSDDITRTPIAVRTQYLLKYTMWELSNLCFSKCWEDNHNNF